MTISERITHLRENELKIKQARFADAIHISRSNLSNIESGRVNITDRVIANICSSYNVSETWLRTGEGEMFAPIDEESELALIFGQALSPDCSPERRRVIKAIMALLDEIPDDMLPQIGKHFRAIADACDPTAPEE